ncbi:MAG: DUF3524 domain-containing protein [Acidobacteriota bacterium]
MRILALEPYYGGSHRAFLDGWSGGSRHEFTALTLPPHHWKWRMRHGALTLAQEAARRAAAGDAWDLVWCSSMLSLAEWKGLAPAHLASLPSAVYFHENQLTYPVRQEDARDFHFAFSHLTTCLAADGVWWNSAFHRDEMTEALIALMGRMPTHRPVAEARSILQKSRVLPPGVAPSPPRPPRRPGPLRLVWAARWEHDKDPDTFFGAVLELDRRGVDFRLDVLGESFRRTPEVFDRARGILGAKIGRWGFLPHRTDYLEALLEADVFVSTARHEFFGIAAVEAMGAGCRPLLPERLAYPELLRDVPPELRRDLLYSGGAAVLADRLQALAGHLDRSGSVWPGPVDVVQRAVAPFTWPAALKRLDDAADAVCDRAPV